MLRYALLCLFPLLWAAPSSAQVSRSGLLHAHNDYAQPRPLADAIDHRADFIEADVFLVDNKLVVAHTRAEIDTSRTLEKLYVAPIAERFAAHKNERISRERAYTFSLVIDNKDDAEAVLPRLQELLQRHLVLFSYPNNPLAIRVVVSGNRPKPDRYLDFPSYLFFDGRPSEIYDDETLRHVAMISDNFRNYSRWDGTGTLPDADRDKLKRIIRRAHDEGKPIRFWGAPDTPNAWKQLRKLGVDIINTDKVAEARAFLK